MGLTALLVDDHTMLRQGLRRGLEAEGIVVVGEAADGEEAVRMAIELRPDVVVMDVSMPNVDVCIFATPKAIGIASFLCRKQHTRRCNASGRCIATRCCCFPIARVV